MLGHTTVVWVGSDDVVAVVAARGDDDNSTTACSAKIVVRVVVCCLCVCESVRAFAVDSPRREMAREPNAPFTPSHNNYVSTRQAWRVV